MACKMEEDKVEGIPEELLKIGYDFNKKLVLIAKAMTAADQNLETSFNYLKAMKEILHTLDLRVDHVLEKISLRRESLLPSLNAIAELEEIVNNPELPGPPEVEIGESTTSRSARPPSPSISLNAGEIGILMITLYFLFLFSIFFYRWAYHNLVDKKRVEVMERLAKTCQFNDWMSKINYPKKECGCQIWSWCSCEKNKDDDEDIVASPTARASNTLEIGPISGPEDEWGLKLGTINNTHVSSVKLDTLETDQASLPVCNNLPESINISQNETNHWSQQS